MRKYLRAGVLIPSMAALAIASNVTAAVAATTTWTVTPGGKVRFGEANVSASVIMAKTGHKSLRSVQRYVKPGLAAVHAATETLLSPRRRG